MSVPLKHTPLAESHVSAGARMVDFGGWNMPLAYGSQIEEHHAVRQDAGMFDVSHMQNVDLAGPDARAFLRRLLANDVDKLTTVGRALYSCMLKPTGGVIDDLIVYFIADDQWRIVVNAATAPKDVAWMNRVAQAGGFDVTLTPRTDLAMIAVQGPNARAKVWAARPDWQAASESLAPFNAARFEHCKPGAILFNVGRGNAIHEGDLLTALRTGKLGMAVLDVFAQEPLPRNAPRRNARRDSSS